MSTAVGLRKGIFCGVPRWNGDYKWKCTGTDRYMYSLKASNQNEHTGWESTKANAANQQRLEGLLLGHTGRGAS